MGSLLLHLLHQPRPLDHIRKARIVFHVGGDGHLAAGLDALDQHGFKHRARRIDRSGIASRAGTDDDDLGVDGGGHRADPFRKGIWQGMISAWAEFARKGIATAPKVSNPSLGYLASYARIAIHIGKISPPLR